MRWRMGRRSDNLEDRRGMRAGGRPVLLGGGGLLLLVVVAVTVLSGGDLSDILRLLGEAPSQEPLPGDASLPQGATPDSMGVVDEQADFVSVVLADTEDVWSGLFAARGGRYRPPTLVLFTDTVRSACGLTSAAAGPFYCPGDGKVYIDLGFYRELRDQFGAPGDFAQAYVIAHEVGHHVQNLLGISEEIQRLRRRGTEEEANRLSVRLELQADCLAGVWGHHAQAQRQLLEEGDIEEGLRAAAAIGDDRLQRMGGGVVNPESWTHGSSDQRVGWFRRGFESGEMDDCDTFGGARP